MNKNRNTKKNLSKQEQAQIMDILARRFEKNPKRHKGVEWSRVAGRLQKNTEKLWSINEMEKTGGEPDVIGEDKKTGELIFCDCSAESPSGRRSVCYDEEALDARKEHKPADSALNMAARMGIEILNEEQYRRLQEVGKFDAKTSSWIETPDDIRKLGGALFADYRYGHVFVYHNGAQSYYAARGFRGLVKV